MEVSLKIVDGPSKGKVFTLNKDEIIIGRSKECTIKIPAKSVSKRHCRIWQEGDRLFIADLNSTNGTLVNGMKLERDMPLKSGDRIKLPVLEFEITYGEEGETQVALDELLLEIEDSGKETLEPLEPIEEDKIHSTEGDIEEVEDLELLEEIEDDDILDIDELDDIEEVDEPPKNNK